MSDFDLASWRARLGVACDGTRFSSVTVLPTCASTQDVAATLPKGSIVAAGEQTSGRGRRGRAWSDGGGRSVSVSFVVDSMASARLSTASVLSVLDAMTSFGGGKGTVGCKFPNDVLACIDGGRKVAGVLVEGNADRMVIGIGLNVLGQLSSTSPRWVHQRVHEVLSAATAEEGQRRASPAAAALQLARRRPWR